jgi:hypothetical protein
MKPLAGYRGTGPPATPERWLRRALLDWVIIILCFRAAHWSLFETTSLMMRVATLVPLVVVIAARASTRWVFSLTMGRIGSSAAIAS